MDPAASAALEQKYKKLWTQYKLTVTSLYFTDKPLSGNGDLFTWQGGNGVKASKQDPIVGFLQTPRLHPDLEQYLKD